MILKSKESETIELISEHLKESPKILRLRTLKLLSTCAFWFLLGVFLANISRFVPGAWVIYWIILTSVSAYMLCVVPNSAEQNAIATRRMSAIALILSFAAYWDLIVAVLNLPCHIFLWILPFWLVVMLMIATIGIFIAILNFVSVS